METAQKQVDRLNEQISKKNTRLLCQGQRLRKAEVRAGRSRWPRPLPPGPPSGDCCGCPGEKVGDA